MREPLHELASDCITHTQGDSYHQLLSKTCYIKATVLAVASVECGAESCQCAVRPVVTRSVSVRVAVQVIQTRRS